MGRHHGIMKPNTFYGRAKVPAHTHPRTRSSTPKTTPPPGQCSKPVLSTAGILQTPSDASSMEASRRHISSKATLFVASVHLVSRASALNFVDGVVLSFVSYGACTTMGLFVRHEQMAGNTPLEGLSRKRYCPDRCSYLKNVFVPPFESA